MMDYGVEWEIDNKTCTACVYRDEDLYFGKHCNPCLFMKDGKEIKQNFNPDTVDNIINRLIGE